MTFDDGSVQDFTRETAASEAQNATSRLSYRVDPPHCAYVDAVWHALSCRGGQRQQLFVRSCWGFVQLGLGTIRAVTSFKLVYWSDLTSILWGIRATTRPSPLSFPGARCLLGTYMRASARITAYLTDAIDTAIDVTSVSSVTSSDFAVLATLGSLVIGQRPGGANISATFGSSFVARELIVSGTLASMSAVNWALQHLPSDSVSLTRNGSQQTEVSVTYTTTTGRASRTPVCVPPIG